MADKTQMDAAGRPEHDGRDAYPRMFLSQRGLAAMALSVSLMTAAAPIAAQAQAGPAGPSYITQQFVQLIQRLTGLFSNLGSQVSGSTGTSTSSFPGANTTLGKSITSSVNAALNAGSNPGEAENMVDCMTGQMNAALLSGATGQLNCTTGVAP